MKECGYRFMLIDFRSRDTLVYDGDHNELLHNNTNVGAEGRMAVVSSSLLARATCLICCQSKVRVLAAILGTIGCFRTIHSRNLGRRHRTISTARLSVQEVFGTSTAATPST